MAFKLGGFFDAAFDLIDSKSKEMRKSTISESQADIEKSLNKLKNKIDETEEKIENYRKIINDTSLTQEERDKAEKSLTYQVRKSIKLGQEYDAFTENSIKLERESLKLDREIQQAKIRQQEDFSEILAQQFGKSSVKTVGKLSQTMGIDKVLKNFGNKFDGVKVKAFGDITKKLTGSLSGGLSDFGATAYSTFKGYATKLLGPWGFLIDAIESGVKAAYQQIMEANKLLIDTMRSTGGIFKGGGLDSFGNQSAAGAGSLKTISIKANVDQGDIMNQIKTVSKGLGQIAGQTNFFSKQNQKALFDFGVEASKMAKFYNADIGPSVTGLIKDFGVDVGQATNLMVDGISKAKQAGLDPGKFAENMAEAVDLAGKLHFTDGIKGMEKMAMLATKMGTSISAITDGMTKMKGLNDLFVKQQEAAALGMHNQAQALSKIYALQKQGKQAEAAAVEADAIIQDLKSQGLTNDKGEITTGGIATLEAMGKSEKDIANLQRMSIGSKKTGLSAQEFLIDADKLSPEKKKARQQFEKENRSIEEQANMLLGSIQQSFIDPIAKLVGPFVKQFLDISEAIINPLLGFHDLIMMTLEPSIEFLTTIWDEVADVFQDAFGPLSDMFDMFKSEGSGFITMLKDVNSIIAKYFMMPFRILGKIIGGIYSGIAESLLPIFQELNQIFAPLFDSIGGINDGFEGIYDVLDPLIGFIGDLVGGTFALLGNILVGTIKGIILIFKGLGLAIGKVIDFFSDILEPFKGFKDILDGFMDWIKNGWIGKMLGLSPDEDAKKEQVGLDSAINLLNNYEIESPVDTNRAFMTNPISFSREEIENEQAIQKVFNQTVSGETQTPNVNIQIKQTNSLSGEIKTKMTGIP